MTERLKPEFVEHASTGAIRAQYERAEANAALWTDRARDLFLLLCQREEQDSAGYATAESAGPEIVSIRSSACRSGHNAHQ